MSINLVIWAVMLFIAGCVLADAARKYDNDKKRSNYTFCSYLKARNADARCGHLIGATVSQSRAYYSLNDFDIFDVVSVFYRSAVLSPLLYLQSMLSSTSSCL